MNSSAYPLSVRAFFDQPSRALWLVKWLLLIPHYIILAFLWLASWYSTPSLIGASVLIAAIALLFTARYPTGLYDLVVGINRWSYRLVVYVALMTDQYPPFRLDQGGHDPESLPEPAPASETSQ